MIFRSMTKNASFVILFPLFLCATINVRAQSAADDDINYEISMSNPSSHLLEVQMKVASADMKDKLEVKMPVWTPGSYLVREYAMHVQDFAATNGIGKQLRWRKINKNTWQIDNPDKTNAIDITYRVYSNTLTVRTNELNDEHAFIVPSATLMFPKGDLKKSSIVKINPYGNWKVATGLPKVAGETNTFRAPNYDILYDSPYEVSNFTEKKFTVRGIPHRFVVTGEGNYDLEKIALDTAKILEEQFKLFGEFPYKDYTFILNLRGGGGLEHLNSTALQWNPYGFAPHARYVAFLSLVTHEYFHLFNVKRIRPEPLGPFDYENENYTKLLWVAEGLTSYYEGVLMRRAGIVGADYILNNSSRLVQHLQGRPGRFKTSLEEASFDAWIKYYRQDENSVNNQISYYSKGELVNFLLDAKIRSDSDGTKSMDDVLKYLYTEFYGKDKNYSSEDFQKVCEMMSGGSLDDFFARYIRGRDEIDYNSILAPFGLQLKIKTAESDVAYLGANLAEANGILTIRSLSSDSPAYKSGLNARDQIVALDGYQATRSGLTLFLSQQRAGDKMRISIFRNNRLRDIEVTLGRTPATGYEIVPVADPSTDQNRLYRGLFGESLVAKP